MKTGRFDDRWPVRRLALGIVVTGILCVPLAVVSAILGRFPMRGALLAGAILFTAIWLASTLQAHPSHVFGADQRIRHSSPSHR